MKKILQTLLLIVTITLASNVQLVYAQNQHTIDSLLNRLETATNDTSKVDILNVLSLKHTRSNPGKARNYAIQAIQLAENIVLKKGISDGLNNIGIIHYYQGNYKKAIEYFEKALKIDKELGNKRTILYRLGNIGLLSIRQGNYTKAIEYSQKALEIAEELGDKGSISKAINNIGLVYQYQSNYNKAIEYYQKALKIKEELGDKGNISSSLHNIGNIYYKLGNYIKAIEYYQKALKISEELGDKRTYSSSLMNIGLIHKEQDNNTKAIEYYQKALKISEELGNKIGISDCLNNIGTIYEEQDNYTKAIEYSQKSLKIREELGDKKGVSASLNNIGNIQISHGNYSEAIKYYQKALKLSEELGDKESISRVLNNIGNIHNKQGNYSKAIEHYQKALKIDEELGNKIGTSTRLRNIGTAYLRQKIYNRAHDYLKKSLELNYEMGVKSKVVHSLDLFGSLHFNQGNYKKALQYYQKGLITNLPGFSDSVIYHNPRKLNALSKPLLLTSLNGKAKSFYSIYTERNSIKDLKASLSAYDLVFRLSYEMRNDYNHESPKLLLSEKTKGYYSNALLAAFDFTKIKPGNESREKAFEYFEKSKSATLGSYLNDLKIKQLWNVSNTILKKEKEIAIMRQVYETKIQKAKTKNDGYDTLVIQGYQEQLFNYSRQNDSLINVLKNDYPDYYKLKYEQKVASIAEVQNHLDENTALINYFVANSSLFISIVTKDTIKYEMVKTNSLFNEKLIDYHIDVKSLFIEKNLESSVELYNYLISPIEEQIKNKSNLIVVPDGHLYYIPFETLCKSVTYSNDLSKIDYLVKNYSISYHHSATLWLNSVEKSKKQMSKNKSFIGFAPVFDPKVNNGFILSSNWISDTTKAETATREISSDLKHFNTLPHSKKEIQAIVRLFNKKGENAKGFFHHEATEENFKQNTHKYNYIHIASHSFANDNFPKLSGIAFSQPDTLKIKEENGILYVGETYNLNLLKAKLIVLSSCASGLGKLVKGEGLLSLSRGFLYSGTPNIIFSLWNVKDEQTKDLMIQFYKKVLKGENYTKALRKAKLKLISDPKTALPKYWAAWILVGE